MEARSPIPLLIGTIKVSPAITRDTTASERTYSSIVPLQTPKSQSDSETIDFTLAEEYLRDVGKMGSVATMPPIGTEVENVELESGSFLHARLAISVSWLGRQHWRGKQRRRS